MTTLYPGALDTNTQLKNDATDSTVSAVTHAAQHNNVADAIRAIEAELGLTPKGTYATVAANLLDKVKLAPGADQIVQPSGDFVGLAVRANAAQSLSNLIDVRNSAGTIIGYWDRLGNLSANGFKVNGVALASTHLSDAANLTVPSGTILQYGGYSTPTGYLFADASSVLRSTYSALMSAITFTQSVTTTNASTTVTVADSSLMFVGVAVEGTGIPAGATVASIVSATSITISGLATASGTVTARFFPHGNGDGSTTFNMPDMRGRMVVGKGTHSDITALGKTDGTALANRRPTHKHTVVQPTISVTGNPTISVTGNPTITISDPGHAHSFNNFITVPSAISGTGGGRASSGDSGQPGINSSTTGISASASGGSYSASGGSYAASSGTVGPQTGAEPLDTPAYIVLQYIIKT